MSEAGSYFKLRSYLLIIAFFIISGCGSATLRPEIPVNIPLTPSVIYVPECTGRSSGLFGAMNGRDGAWGRGLCAALEPALEARVAKTGGRFKLARANFHVEKAPVEKAGISGFFHALQEKMGKSFDIVPNEDAETSIGARYRVVLAEPESYRVTDKYGSYVVAEMSFEIVDISSNKVILHGNLKPKGSGAIGASNLVDRLIRGLDGPRCETLNGWSIKGALKDPMRDKCDTFALPPQE